MQLAGCPIGFDDETRMTPPQNILFLGCGDLGGRAATRLVAQGHRVQALRRNPQWLPDGVTGVRFDLMNGSGTPEDLVPPSAVIFMLSAGRADEARYRAVYVDSLRRALTFPAVRRASRLIFVSSTSVYGQRNGEWIDETSVTEPARYNGRVLLEAEAVARSHGGAVVLRLAGLYGPGRERNIRWAREGRPCVFEPPQYTNRIHIDDAAALVAHLATLQNPSSCYIGVDSEPAPHHAVMTWLANAQGAPPPPAAHAAESSSPGSKRCSNQLVCDTGFSFRYPTFREGYGAVLAAMRAREGDAPPPGAGARSG